MVLNYWFVKWMIIIDWKDDLLNESFMELVFYWNNYWLNCWFIKQMNYWINVGLHQNLFLLGNV